MYKHLRKIIYIANARIPTNRAHGKQIIKTCEAISKLGIRLELWIPDRVQTKDFHQMNPFTFYNVQEKFLIKKFSTIDLFSLKPRIHFLEPVYFYLQEVSFVWSLLQKNINDTVYSRCLTACLFIKIFKKVPVYYEAHNVSPFPLARIFYKWLFTLFDGLVFVSDGIKEAYGNTSSSNKACIIPNGVDLLEFRKVSDVSALRKKLGVTFGKKLILYCGSISQEKGVLDLIKAASFLDKDKFIIAFLGPISPSIKDQIDQEKNLRENLYFLNWVLPKDVPPYLMSADILVALASSNNFFSQKITCPIKIFEYLAVGKPIIAADTPAHRAILEDNKTAIFTPSGNPKALAVAISAICNNPELTKRLTHYSQMAAQNYTWEIRAQKIIELVT